MELQHERQMLRYRKIYYAVCNMCSHNADFSVKESHANGTIQTIILNVNFCFRLSVIHSYWIIVMATGGLVAELNGSGGNTATDNRTSPEEPWSTVAADVYKARVWEDLRKLFQQGKLTDVMLPGTGSGQSIPCHRVLLAAASTFFYEKFVVHPESFEHNLLNIEGIDFDTLTDIMSFVYDGQVQLTVEKTEKLLPASVHLMLPELTSMCKDFLLHKVDRDTSACIDITQDCQTQLFTTCSTEGLECDDREVSRSFSNGCLQGDV